MQVSFLLLFVIMLSHLDKINSILSHKMFIPLSKTTFCAYLIHPVLLQTYYLSRPTAFHFTHSFQLVRHIIHTLSLIIYYIFSSTCFSWRCSCPMLPLLYCLWPLKCQLCTWIRSSSVKEPKEQRGYPKKNQ